MRATTATPFGTLAGYEAAARHEAWGRGLRRAATYARNLVLFAAAPFIGLAYALAFPVIGIGALGWLAVRAARERRAA